MPDEDKKSEGTEQSNELTEKEAAEERAALSNELWPEDDGREPESKPAFEAITEEKPGDSEKPAAETKEKESAPDLWAGVNPALKEKFESMEKQLANYDAVSGRLKQAESRIGSITNELADAKKEAKDLKSKQEDAPTQKEIDAAAESDEAWEELKDEFPVWAGAIDTRLAAESTKFAKTDKLNEVLERIDAIEKRGVIEPNQLEELKIDLRYPDWKATVKTPEFHGWIEKQNAEIIAKADSTKAVDAIEVLDLYSENNGNGNNKKTAAEIEQERQQRLKSSELPSSKRKRMPVKSEEDMTDEEYREQAAREAWAED